MDDEKDLVVITEEKHEAQAEHELEEISMGDRALHPDRPLSPRHRKLAEYMAMGKTNYEMAELLSYTPSRVSVLRSNTRISDLADEIRDRVFEESVGNRLKRMANPALNVLEECLLDKRNIFKTSEKLDTARWVVEKLDGKATQKLDVSGGILVGLMDKLDAMKVVGHDPTKGKILDVTPQDDREKMIKAISKPKAPETPEEKQANEEDALKSWVLDNI